MATASPVPPSTRLPPLAALLRALGRYRALLIGLPLAGVIVGAGMVVFNRQYTADGFFTPQTSPKNSGSFSLGTLLGLPGNVVGPESVEFFRTLITSRDLLAVVVQTTYHFAKERGGSDSLSGTLLDLYRVNAATPLDRVSQAVGTLRRNIGIGVDRQAMIIDVRVTTPWPELSEQVAARLLELLNQFNLEKRHSRYISEQRLIEERLDSAGHEVLIAKDAQKREEARQIYQSLRQTYERARIEEAQDIPTVTVLQSPIGTARAVPPLSQGVGLGFLIGALGALSMALIGEYAARERELQR